MKDTVVLYHANCPDGFSGAWVARKKFGKKADYIAVKHHEPVPLGLDDKDVYIIDFSYSDEDTDSLISKAKSFTQIDHHISSKKVTKSVPNNLYSDDNSGAVLAWKYFFPDEDVPIFLKYIDDIDLWKFNMPRAEDFLAFSATVPYKFDRWDTVVEDFEDEGKRDSYLDKGKNLLEYQNKLIAEMIENGEEVELSGHRALAVNSSVLSSQVGNAIVNRGYEIGIIWGHSNDVIKVSLRSNKEGDVDVGKIAEKYGGGGHKSASGFTIKDEAEFPWQTKNT